MGTSPRRAEVDTYREKISGYTPGKESVIDNGSEYRPPRKMRIGVFGVMGSGKSAWINSTFSAYKDNWEEHAKEGEALHQEGETFIPWVYKLTDLISVVDARGMKDFGIHQLRDIMKAIKKPDEREAILCPVFVFRHSDVIDSRVCRTFLNDFVRDVKNYYGTYPIAVITHTAKLEGKRRTTLRDQFISYGMAGESVFLVENYTADQHDFDEHKHLALLEILWKCIKRADENHARRYQLMTRNPSESGWCSIQ